MAVNRIGLLIIAVSVSTLSGCLGAAGIQDWHYNHVNRSRAASAWNSNYDRGRRRELGSDFKDGYKAGHFDMATGKDCRVPPVAPPKYWSASYQTASAQSCIQAWFRGYQCGMAAAESCGYGAFNDVPVSACAPAVNCGGSGQCSSADPCSCGTDSCSCLTSQTDANPSTALASFVRPVGKKLGVQPASGLIGPVDLPTSGQRDATPASPSTQHAQVR